MISIGDKVNYHGTLKEKHGVYSVYAIPPFMEDRGYALRDLVDIDVVLLNVHRDSFDLLPE